jgi:hypothetical protein
MTGTQPTLPEKVNTHFSAIRDAGSAAMLSSYERDAAHAGAISALQKYAALNKDSVDVNAIEGAISKIQSSKLEHMSKSNAEGGSLSSSVNQTADALENRALTEGLVKRGLRDGAKNIVLDYDPQAVSGILGDEYKHILNNQEVDKAAREGVKNAKTSLAGNFQSVHHSMAQKMTEAPATSWTERMGRQLTREKEILGAAWNHGVDARTGEVKKFAKTKVGIGVAVTGFGLVDAARRVYVGIAGEENPETGKKESHVIDVVLGGGEAALALLAGRKLATGHFLTR